jgi:hypothetical protein
MSQHALGVLGLMPPKTPEDGKPKEADVANG